MPTSSGKSGDYRVTLERALEELRIKTAAHDRMWQLGQADWSVDQDAGEICFTSPTGIVATCSVQIVGTYDTDDGTWLWGWDHPSVDEPLAEHARAVLAFGERHGVPALTTRKVSCSEDQAWEFAALACHLAGAQGAYRGPAGSTLVFFTFGKPSLSGQAGET